MSKTENPRRRAGADQKPLRVYVDVWTWEKGAMTKTGSRPLPQMVKPEEDIIHALGDVSAADKKWRARVAGLITHPDQRTRYTRAWLRLTSFLKTLIQR